MAGLSAVPLGSKDCFVPCFRRKRTLGGLPTTGTDCVWKPRGDSSHGPGCIPPTLSGTRGIITPDPLWPRQGPKLHQEPDPRKLCSGRRASMELGIPRNLSRTGAGVHHPPPQSVGALPQPPAQSPLTCAPVGRVRRGCTLQIQFGIRLQGGATSPGLPGLQVCDHPGLGGVNGPNCRGDSSWS